MEKNSGEVSPMFCWKKFDNKVKPVLKSTSVPVLPPFKIKDQSNPVLNSDSRCINNDSPGKINEKYIQDLTQNKLSMRDDNNGLSTENKRHYGFKKKQESMIAKPNILKKNYQHNEDANVNVNMEDFTRRTLTTKRTGNLGNSISNRSSEDDAYDVQSAQIFELNKNCVRETNQKEETKSVHNDNHTEVKHYKKPPHQKQTESISTENGEMPNNSSIVKMSKELSNNKNDNYM